MAKLKKWGRQTVVDKKTCAVEDQGLLCGRISIVVQRKGRDTPER